MLSKCQPDAGWGSWGSIHSVPAALPALGAAEGPALELGGAPALFPVTWTGSQHWSPPTCSHPAKPHIWPASLCPASAWAKFQCPCQGQRSLLTELPCLQLCPDNCLFLSANSEEDRDGGDSVIDSACTLCQGLSQGSLHTQSL